MYQARTFFARVHVRARVGADLSALTRTRMRARMRAATQTESQQLWPAPLVKPLASMLTTIWVLATLWRWRWKHYAWAVWWQISGELRVLN